MGLDVRPALFGRTGFGRVVRETVRALSARDDVVVRPFAAAWRRARPDSRLPGTAAPRIPARVQSWLAPLGFGVETLLGPLDVYHHTDLVFAPVAHTPEVLTLYDLVFLADARWHEPGFGRRVMARLRPRASAARAIVVPCARVATDVMRNSLAPSARVHVAPLGADHMDGTPQPDDAARVERVLRSAGLDAAREAPLVLVPGTREPRKNQRALLEAFLATTGGVPASMLFVGPHGWGCDALETRLHGLRARSGAGTGGDTGTRTASRNLRQVGVAGEVSEEDLAALFRSCDVVAYPSLAEGFGLPVAEAMRCGRAVLTSVGTPMADFGGDAVLAVEPRDPIALSAALERLLREPSLRRELGAAAAVAISPMTWAAHTDALVDVYRAALS